MSDKKETWMDMEDKKIVYGQKSPDHERKITYNIDRCTGCGLCVKACPLRCIELAPMSEVATGVIDVPPIFIDHTVCGFCGICVGVCPFHSLKMEMDGEEFDIEEVGAKLIKDVEITEKCLPCRLCAKACPEEAIELVLEPIDRMDYIEGEIEEVEGEVEFNEDECVYCGLCEGLCDAIEVVWRDPTPDNPNPIEEIILHKDKCDFCKVCEVVCPKGRDCFKVDADITWKVKEFSPKGEIKVDKEKCVYCGTCEELCPFEGIIVHKPFEGDITVIEEKCDPEGCEACIKICPGRAFFVPKKESIHDQVPKIAVRKGSCNFCGACENACRLEIVCAKRDKMNVTDFPIRSNTNTWKRAFDLLVDGAEPFESYTFLQPPPVEEVEEKEEEVEYREVDESILEGIRAGIDSVLSELDKSKVRFQMERGEPEKVKKTLEKKK